MFFYPESRTCGAELATATKPGGPGPKLCDDVTICATTICADTCCRTLVQTQYVPRSTPPLFVLGETHALSCIHLLPRPLHLGGIYPAYVVVENVTVHFSRAIPGFQDQWRWPMASRRPPSNGRPRPSCQSDKPSGGQATGGTQTRHCRNVRLHTMHARTRTLTPHDASAVSPLPAAGLPNRVCRTVCALCARSSARRRRDGSWTAGSA